MNDITTLRELRPAPPPAELEAMRMAARERFAAATAPGTARRPAPTRHRRRLPVLAGGIATAAVAAGAAAALVLTSGTGAVSGQHSTTGQGRTVVTTAWTVREDADGTVTIDLREYANPGALQQTLQADGINAIVRQIPTESLRYGDLTVSWPTCNYFPANTAPDAVQRAVVTITRQLLPVLFVIRPAAMPPGSALFLQFLAGMSATPKNDNTGVIAIKPLVLTDAAVSACVPRTKPTPPISPLSKKN